jgi:hypothetical protein
LAQGRRVKKEDCLVGSVVEKQFVAGRVAEWLAEQVAEWLAGQVAKQVAGTTEENGPAVVSENREEELNPKLNL